MIRPKLLFVVTEDWYFASHRLPLAAAARDEGFEVHVATEVNDHAASITNEGLTLHRAKLNRRTMSPRVAYSEMLGLRRLYRNIAPDIVHHVALKPVVLGSLAARRVKSIKGIVNAVAGLGTVFSSSSATSRIMRLPMKTALRAALMAPKTRVIVQNHDDLDELVRARLAEASSIRLLPGAGVDLAALNVPPPPAGVPLVVLPARLLPLKGIYEFVGAARILKSKGLAVRMALVGSPDKGNPTSITQSELDAWKQEGAVEVWGYRNDMPRVLAEATIVCLPTYYREGMPKTLLEAAAARRAIVTTDVPGAREIVRNGEAGWMVPPRDAAALAAALQDAISNPEKRERFAAAALDDARKSYDANSINAQTLAIYRELLASLPTAPIR